MPKVFSQAAIKYFGEVYTKSSVRNNGTGGGCMIAAYEGIGALFGSDYGFKGRIFNEFRENVSTNEFDDLLEYLEDDLTQKNE